MSSLIRKKSVSFFALRTLPCAGVLLLVQPIILVQACGKNVVEKYSPANDQEKAELEMETGNYATAAERLNKVLADEPENHSARSLLAAAYAAQAGITTLGLIRSAASAGASGQTGLTALNSALPTSTLDALAFMSQACEAMEAIPSDSRTTEMKLQYSLFFSSYALLQIKYFTDNPGAIADLSVEDAAKLILTLAKASEAGGSSPISTAVKTFATTLEQTPGSSIDKVKTVLTAKSSGSGG